MKKWISLFLIILLLLSSLSGCKTKEEDLAVSDSWIGEVPSEEKEDSSAQKQDPSEEKAPSEQKQPEKEAPAQKEESSGEQVEQTSEPPEEELPEPPAEEPKDPVIEEDPQEEKLPPVQKESSGTSITIISQNIIHAGYSYGEKGDGTGNNIYNRLRRFKTMVMEQDPDVIFVNEARRGTIDFFEKDSYIANNYTTVWKYRWFEDNNKVTGGDQAEPVLYKTIKYKVLEQGHFWLSQTPNKPSVSYDSSAAYGDISSWVYLQDKQTGAKFYAYCTHFSPSGDEVPIKAMAQYHSEVKKARKKDPNAYIFVGGDYNVYYRSATRYDLMMDWDYIMDLRDVALNMYEDGLTQLGGMGSGHNLAFGQGEQYPAVNTSKPQIDYVMACPNPHMAVDYYGFDYTIYDHAADDVKHGHISDHWGLVVKVRINTDADYSQYQKQHIYGEDPIYFNTDIKYYGQ